VPQDREGTFSTRLFSRYQRNEKALVLALMESL
jgi:transposase-like protein